MAQPDHPESATTPASLSIVALDDDEDFRQFIRSMLETDGHAVRTVETPGALYEACEEHLPDVILLDMKMGRYSGESVLEEIRKRWPKVCVVIITGYPSMDSMRQTFKRDVFDYLAKPFSFPELQRVLAQATASLGLGQRPQDRLRRELGRHIRLARAERGWTLKDLSEASSLSVSQLSSIERGAHLPSLESLIAVGEALAVKPSVWLQSAGL